jgi:hypothetical protein
VQLSGAAGRLLCAALADRSGAGGGLRVLAGIGAGTAAAAALPLAAAGQRRRCSACSARRVPARRAGMA